MKKKYYYRNKTTEIVSFYVIDAIQTDPTVYLEPDVIQLNGSPVTISYDSTTNLITMEVPYGSNFNIVVSKSGYKTSDSLPYTSQTLNHATIQLVPIVPGQTAALLSWYDPSGNTVDFDSHMMIYNGTEKIGEITYQQSYRVFEDANTKVSLDHDDVDETEYNGNETTTINPLYSGYKYVLVILDWTHKDNPSTSELATRNAICQYVPDQGNGKTIEAANATVVAAGPYWEVFEINNGIMTEINKITDQNTYNLRPSR